MEEVSFVDQFVESDIEPTEQLEFVAKDIPNLADAGTKVSFHDQSVGSDMEIAKHLVMDDLVFVGDELYIAKHLVVSNDIFGVVSLACVDGDLHISANIEFFLLVWIH